MNRVVVVLAFVIPVALAGVVVALLMSSNGGVGVDYASKSEFRVLSERTERLDDRLSEVLDEVRQLRSSIPSGEGYAAATPESAEDVAELQDRLGQLETVLTRSGTIDEEELLAFTAPTKEHIKGILDEVREQEREEERTRRREREEESIRRRVDGMAERLRLSGGQSDSMIEILLAESTARREMFTDRMGGPGDTDESGRTVFEKMAAARDEKDAALQETLDSWQYDEYKKIESEQNPWRRRGGGGRPGGDGGSDGEGRRGRGRG